jgi:DNA-binding GntR family transcriptional regulator
MNYVQGVPNAIREGAGRRHARVRCQIEEGYEAHRRFHFLVYEKAGSTLLLHVIRSIWDHTERHRRVAIRWGVEPEDLGRYHEEMLAALVGRDPDKAIEAVRQHFERPLRLIESRMRDTAGA